MPASLGSAALGVAFLTAVFAVVTALTGATGERRWVDVSRRAVYVLCALLTFCVVVIEIAFGSDDFSYNIVQQHSSIETPTFYKMAAMWSSQEGSLLLWAWVLSIVASLALYATRDKLHELVPWATAVMAGVASFFTGLMLFAGGVNPFATLDPAPASSPRGLSLSAGAPTPSATPPPPPAGGVALTPLPQPPSMMTPPPMLY